MDDGCAARYSSIAVDMCVGRCVRANVHTERQSNKQWTRGTRAGNAASAANGPSPRGRGSVAAGSSSSKRSVRWLLACLPACWLAGLHMGAAGSHAGTAALNLGLSAASQRLNLEIDSFKLAGPVQFYGDEAAGDAGLRCLGPGLC